MGTLNSPSLRVVKDSTSSRLDVEHFGIGESSPILFFGNDESSPNDISSKVSLERTCVLLFYYFLYLKVKLDFKKKQQQQQQQNKTKQNKTKQTKKKQKKKTFQLGESYPTLL